jgi:CDP-glucose 4,6-dehydratase
MADIATQSWIENFIESPIAVVRAGNVIGGGDCASKRLIPDLVRGYTDGYRPKLRSISSIRPWQNVLDCLNGYVMLVDNLITEKKSGIWNFGPELNQIKTVGDVVRVFEAEWGLSKYWDLEQTVELNEEQILLVNSTKARKLLGWTEHYTFDENVSRTSKWYRDVSKGKSESSALEDELYYFDSLRAK